MQSRLKQILAEINAVNNLEFKNFGEQDKSGENNEIYFGFFPGLNVQETNEASPVKDEKTAESSKFHVAFSKDRDATDSYLLRKQGQIEEAQQKEEFMRNKHVRLQAVFELMQKNRVRTTFIQSYLYRGNNVTLSQRANMDLNAYMTNTAYQSKLIDRDTLKRMIAQIVLGIAELHKNHLVHRDIKHKNILVSLRNKKIYLQLADLDELAEVNDSNTPKKPPISIALTEGYCAPEVLACWPHPYGYKNNKQYNSLDLKAADCYSLGKTLHELVNVYPDSKTQELVTMIYQLIKNNPHDRLNIEQVMGNVYFGKTQQERETYFLNLEAECRRYHFIDTFYIPNFIPESDAFYLLPSNIKNIYTAGISLDLQITHCMQYQVTDFQTALTAVAMAQSTQKNALALMKLINAALTQQDTNQFHACLSTLKEEISNLISKGIHLFSLTADYLNNQFALDTAPSKTHNEQKSEAFEKAVNNMLSISFSVKLLMDSALISEDLKKCHTDLNKLSITLEKMTALVKSFFEYKKENKLTENMLRVIGLFSSPTQTLKSTHSKLKSLPPAPISQPTVFK
jgi:serine/threonine protein kinase